MSIGLRISVLRVADNKLCWGVAFKDWPRAIISASDDQ